MESIAHSGHGCGPIENAPESGVSMTEDFSSEQLEVKDWPAGRLANGAEGLAAGSPAAVLSTESDPTLEQIKQLLLRESLRFRQNTSGSMTVVVCLEDGAELLVHFAQRDGGIDLIARCDPADAPRLGVLWPRLQQALASRRIRLAPLRSSLAQRPPANTETATSFQSDRRKNGIDRPANPPGWETWA
jgi:hypothetical protein